MRRAAVILALLFAFLPAFAFNPDEVLKDPLLEKRARDLTAQLRCMVCQNQSIDDSDATFARDLRLLVRERLVAGDSDVAVVDYLVSRYGEFVLLRPRFSARTALLWGAPVLLALAAGTAIGLLARRGGRRVAPQVLSAEEEKRLRDLMEK